MAGSTPQSLRRVLLVHEITFVFLVVVSGVLGATWAWLWQQWSEESIRLNLLSHTAQEIRTQLFKQIQEVSVAALREDARAAEINSDYVGRIQELFNELRRQSAHRGEDYAVQAMQTAFSLLQANLRETLGDSFALNRLVRSQILDPAFGHEFVAGFEAAFESFVGLIELQRSEQERTIARWTTLAPYGLAVPIVIGVALLLFSRRTLLRGFVAPMQEVVAGTRELSDGNLGRALPESGVSEVRELARGINRMAHDLQASRAAVLANERQSALGGLVPVVAHNIRNPLAAIRANAQLLDGSENTEEIAETRQAIIDTVDRLERWVTALVSYLHPLVPRRRTVTAAQLLNAALELLAVRAEEAAVTCARGAWDEEVEIDADPDLIEQALYGLLNNAIEASPRGSAIHCAVERRGAEVALSITDEGGGLPFQPEPSELVPGPSTKRFGTGLGIPIAYKICGAHGFSVDFHSNPGIGTRVEIRAAVHESAEQHDPE